MDFGYYGSIVLFVVMSILGYQLILKGNRYNVKKSCEQLYSKKNILNRYYIMLILLFSCFATFRKVGVGLGGYDARNYVNYFLFCRQTDSPYADLITEPLWLLICKMIRLVTSDYHIFFFICYGFIILSFIVFIEKYCPSGIVYTPFVLLMWPYLKDFNTLRSGVAIGILLIALTFIEEKKMLSAILMFSTIFVHRMSVLYIPISVFFYLYKKWYKKLKGYKLAVFYIIFITFSYLASKYLQRYVLGMNVLDTKDRYYIKMSVGQSILSRWPMFFTQVCLLIMILVFEKRIRNTKEITNLRIFVTYDFLMIPASLILGMWRASEYLYLVRIIMWGEVIRAICNLVDIKSKKILRLMTFIVLLVWFVFRIVQESDDLGIIPYVFQFKNEWLVN